jgi:CBS domain-containing protein
MHRAEAGTGRRRSWWLSLFTDANASAAQYVKEHSRRVGDIMTRNVITAGPDTPVAEIAELARVEPHQARPRRGRRQALGIVSRANLVRALAGSSAEAPPRA